MIYLFLSFWFGVDLFVGDVFIDEFVEDEFSYINF